MLTSTIENLLNRGLPRSPRARQLCAELAGRRLAIEIEGITRLVLESTGDSLKLTRDTGGTSTDATIIGGPFGLVSLMGSSPQEVIQRGDVRMEGDTELAGKFHELALLLRPDIEESLAQAIGDVPAHQFGRFARRALNWSRQAASTTVRNFAEYFAHERGDLVSKAEGNVFLKGVDALREDVDRFEARLEILAQKLQKPAQGKPDA